MRVAGRKHLGAFAELHPKECSQVDAWLCEAEESQWLTSHDIQVRYPSASFFAGNRVVFNLNGNRYRLDTRVNYKNQIVLVKRVDHADVDLELLARGN